MLRCGSRFCLLSERFGDANSAYISFNRWIHWNSYCWYNRDL